MVIRFVVLAVASSTVPFNLSASADQSEYVWNEIQRLNSQIRNTEDRLNRDISDYQRCMSRSKNYNLCGYHQTGARSKARMLKAQRRELQKLTITYANTKVRVGAPVSADTVTELDIARLKKEIELLKARNNNLRRMLQDKDFQRAIAAD